jgi:predicted RNase H-like nuclease (RuvC/YqgF family)
MRYGGWDMSDYSQLEARVVELEQENERLRAEPGTEVALQAMAAETEVKRLQEDVTILDAHLQAERDEVERLRAALKQIAEVDLTEASPPFQTYGDIAREALGIISKSEAKRKAIQRGEE